MADAYGGLALMADGVVISITVQNLKMIQVLLSTAKPASTLMLGASMFLVRTKLRSMVSLNHNQLSLIIPLLVQPQILL